MSRSRKLRIWWIDDEPDRLKHSARDAIENPDGIRGRRADLEIVPLTKDLTVVNAITKLDEAIGKGNGPDLIVIDQMLELPVGESLLQRGSSVAVAIRDKSPGIAVVGVTGAELTDVGELQKAQFIELFTRDEIQTGARIPDLYAIGDGYQKVRSKYKTTVAWQPTPLDICKLLKCPVSDIELLVKCLPTVLRQSWDSGTSHDFARWIWHCFLRRPGFVYDSLGVATLLGLNEDGFSTIEEKFSDCIYNGVFASSARRRWWVSKIRSKVRALTAAKTSEPLWELGRKLAGLGKHQYFSRCFGHSATAIPASVVAFADGTQKRRVQARIEDTIPLDTDIPPLGFEQSRVYSSS